jgi:phytoene dehydrogenase-like protein
MIGNGTGDWDVPVGGMGHVTAELARAAREAGAEIRTGAEVTVIDPDGEVTGDPDGEYTVGAGHIWPTWPGRAGRLTGAAVPAANGSAPEGAQLKVNLVLQRLPRLRDPGVTRRPRSRAFHVHGVPPWRRAYRQAAAGQIGVRAVRAYCHSLTDPSILGPERAASGAHTLTGFGLHMPARLFRADPDGARDAALAATLAALDDVLAEPVTDCLLTDAAGQPCVDVKSPADLEREIYLPGGHIYHQDLEWPFAEDDAGAGRWGVETEHPRLLLCGVAPARRRRRLSPQRGHGPGGLTQWRTRPCQASGKP